MMWKAPHVHREYQPCIGDERTQLEAMVDWHRTTLLAKCAGLTGEELAQRAVPPSNLSLLGLLRHMAEVERGWFRRRVAGEDVPRIYPSDDGDWDAAVAASAESDYATFRAEMDTCRSATAHVSLEDEFTMETWGRSISVRWVYLHLIEEYARHNGHADFLRERIDGTMGY